MPRMPHVFPQSKVQTQDIIKAHPVLSFSDHVTDPMVSVRFKKTTNSGGGDTKKALSSSDSPMSISTPSPSPVPLPITASTATVATTATTTSSPPPTPLSPASSTADKPDYLTLRTRNAEFVVDLGDSTNMVEGSARVIRQMSKQWIYIGCQTLWTQLKTFCETRGNTSPSLLSEQIKSGKIDVKTKAELNTLLHKQRLGVTTTTNPPEAETKQDLTPIVTHLSAIIKDRNKETHDEPVGDGDFTFALKSKNIPSPLSTILVTIGKRNGDVVDDDDNGGDNQ